MTSEEAQAQHLIEWATQIAKAAYHIGFTASGEGRDVADAEADLAPLISQISGQPQQEN